MLGGGNSFKCIKVGGLDQIYRCGEIYRYAVANPHCRAVWVRLRHGYRNEQHVIDPVRQLAGGKLVDTKVMDALEQRGSMPPQQKLMIDAILTVPGTTLEAEQQRRVNAINAVIAFCGVEEGRPTRRPVGPGR
jgi:hypothetical protein